MTATRARWTDYAACVGQDPEIWFADDAATKALALATCAACPVLDACRTYILAAEGNASPSSRFGIAAGMSPKARRTAYERARRAAGQTADPIKPRGWHYEVAPCGTPAAQTRHRRRGETCATCRTPRPEPQPTPDMARRRARREAAA